MDQAEFVRNGTLPRQMPHTALRVSSILLICASATLLIVTVVVGLRESGYLSLLLALVLIALCVVLFLHTRFLLLARKDHRRTAAVLDQTEREFQAIFESALDTILILDDQATCREANPAAERMLGVRREQLLGKSLALFHKDADEFAESWAQLLTNGQKQGYSELCRRNGSKIFVEFTAKANVLPGKHVTIIRDITRRRQAEAEMRRNLAIAESAWIEAEGLRKATLALAQNLQMDYVLDTLLDSLRGLVPFESAQVLLLEGDSRMFLAREVIHRHGQKPEARYPLTCDASNYPVLQRVIATLRGTLLADTRTEPEWRDLKVSPDIRSWLGVPLVGSNKLLGLLSLGHTKPDTFTQEHLRSAQSLGVAAAVAIQNARLYETAEIYASELERRISDLRDAQKALDHSEEGRKASEDRFRSVFRSSPIAFSITTLADGRFVEINEAFERRYGYSRDEVLGRTTNELRIWDDPNERDKMVAEVKSGTSIRNSVTRVRLKSGEVVATIYSAETIQLDGVPCLLVVSEDLHELTQRTTGQ